VRQLWEGKKKKQAAHNFLGQWKIFIKNIFMKKFVGANGWRHGYLQGDS
jgi:hypothetical protein